MHIMQNVQRFSATVVSCCAVNCFEMKFMLCVIHCTGVCLHQFTVRQKNTFYTTDYSLSFCTSLFCF